MNNNFYVYVHTRLDTEEPFYVGKGKDKRAYSKKYRNQYWYNIASKSNYAVDIVYNNVTEKEALDFEVYLINLYKSSGFCEANLTDGGEGLKNPSKETRLKMSNSHKKLYESGYIHPMKGRTHSEETKRKISESNKGKTSSMKGKRHTKETRKKQSEVAKGRKGYWEGKHLTEEIKKKKSEAIKKLWAEGRYNNRKKVEAMV